MFGKANKNFYINRYNKTFILLENFVVVFSSVSLPAATSNKRRTSSNINRSESVREQSEKEKVSVVS